MSDDLSIANEDLTIILRDLGAEMQSIRDGQGREYLWHGDPAFWTGRAPVLFPIVGKTPGGMIAIGDHQAPMGAHGFARRSLFTRLEQGADVCVHQLTPTAEIAAVYPFDFALTVTHCLTGRCLRVSVQVENRGAQDMPFGFGFHPAFAWPLPGAEGQAHQVVLANGAEPAMARLDADGMLPEARFPSPFDQGRLILDPSMFDADAMIFPDGAGDALCYGVAGGPELQFEFEGLPNLALWTKPGAPYLCVEPWHGMAARAGAGAQLSERPFTQHLVPGDAQEFAFSVTFPD